MRIHRAHTFMTEEDRVSRDRRLKRAIDLNIKHTYLPVEIQALQDPLNFYLTDHIDEAKQLREERNCYNKYISIYINIYTDMACSKKYDNNSNSSKYINIFLVKKFEKG